jgi:DNA-binding beta-propeller fold protein YncE
MVNPLRTAVAVLVFVSISLASSADTPPLQAQTPIVVPGGPARYDYMIVDVSRHRLLAAHTGAKSLVSLNLKSRKVKSASVGTAQGVAVDEADNKIFVGCSADHYVAVLNRRTLEKTGEIKTDGPVDAIAFNPKNGMLYACHDDGTHDWVIDGKTDKIVAAVDISGAPEYVVYDPASDRIYQNIKVNDTVQVIDPAKNTVESTWSTSPANSPHGLALDSKTQRLFSAGRNGKLVVLDMKTGKQIATVDIGMGVDQIVFDPDNQRVYCACQGTISVVQETSDGARLLGNVPSPKGAHTITVDPQSHAVWVCYADDKDSYLQEFTVAQ